MVSLAKPQGNRPDAANAAAPDSSMPEPAVNLIRRYLPDLARVNAPPGVNWSGLDSTRAAELLGWQAAYTWGQYVRPPE
jgi:hypothetical protein